QSVSAAQHPFGFQQHQQTDQHLFLGADFPLDQTAGSLELGFVVANKETHQHVGIEAEHQRDRRSIATGLRPFLCRRLASSMTLLVFTRMTTVLSGMSVKVIRSPGSKPRLSRISLGMVV